MARTRLIKPSFFMNEVLAKCDPLARILFTGLWCLADREGKLLDRPQRIKAEVLPYDNVEITVLLKELAENKFITRYEVGEEKIILINNFGKHQHPHKTEAVSTLPNIGGITVTTPLNNGASPADTLTDTLTDTDALAGRKEKFSDSKNPETWSEEVLPFGWYDIAEKYSVPDEQIYKSWRKFKDKSSMPWRRVAWEGWIKGERGAIQPFDQAAE